MKCCNCTSDLIILNTVIVPFETIIECSLCSSKNGFYEDYKTYDSEKTKPYIIQVTNDKTADVAAVQIFNQARYSNNDQDPFNPKPFDYNDYSTNLPDFNMWDDNSDTKCIDASDGDKIADVGQTPSGVTDCIQIAIINDTDKPKSIELFDVNNVLGVSADIEQNNQSYKKLCNSLRNGENYEIQKIRIQTSRAQLDQSFKITNINPSGVINTDCLFPNYFIDPYSQIQDVVYVTKSFILHSNITLQTILLPNTELNITIFFASKKKGLSDLTKSVLAIASGAMMGVVVYKMLQKKGIFDDKKLIVDDSDKYWKSKEERKQARKEARENRKEKREKAKDERKNRIMTNLDYLGNTHLDKPDDQDDSLDIELIKD